MSSIRGHVLVWLIGASSVGALLLSAAAYLVLRGEQNDTLDANLREVALAVAQRATPGAPGSAPPGHPEAHDRIVIATWTTTGQPDYLSDPSVPLRRPPQAGLARQFVGTEAWDAFAVIDSRGTTAAAQMAHAQESRAAESAARLIAPFAAVIALVAVLLVWALRRGLSPLDDAAAALAARGEAALDPLDETRLPLELRPLVRAMNHLLLRLSRSMQAHQRFIADAAHELRTPVAALRLQQQLVDSAPDAASRERALDELRAGIERVGHMTTQLLDLSRVEQPADPVNSHRPVALDSRAASVVAEMAPIAESRRIDLGLQRADPVSVPGDAHQLRILLANLVDNALRYSPAGGLVDVAVSAEAGRAVVTVADSGPGIAPAERERVFVRFYRGAAAHAASAQGTASGVGAAGSGLGLAIAQAVAERHGALLTLHDSPSGGLLARVVFERLDSNLRPGAAAPSASGARGAPA